MAQLKLLRWWYSLGAFLLFLVAVGSLLPVPAIPDLGVSDKSSHLFAYFLLSGWFCLLAGNHRVFVLSLLGLLGFGLVIEALQGLSGYRHAEWGDVVANASGCLLGAFAYAAPLRRIFARFDNLLAAKLAA